MTLMRPKAIICSRERRARKRCKRKRTWQSTRPARAGIMTLLPEPNMGKNLGLTMLYFFVCCSTFAYLADFALKPGSDPGADFITVFRFVSTVALFTFAAAVVQHAIWFKMRVVGHVIESIAYSLIAGAIFAALWP